jgi:hypothetical protein
MLNRFYKEEVARLAINGISWMYGWITCYETESIKEARVIRALPRNCNGTKTAELNNQPLSEVTSEGKAESCLIIFR